MGDIRWTPDRIEQLERAARLGQRVVLMRRGTEYIVTARRLMQHSGREVLVGFLPMTGEELRFELNDVESIQVLP